MHMIQTSQSSRTGSDDVQCSCASSREDFPRGLCFYGFNILVAGYKNKTVVVDEGFIAMAFSVSRADDMTKLKEVLQHLRRCIVVVHSTSLIFFVGVVRM